MRLFERRGRFFAGLLLLELGWALLFVFAAKFAGEQNGPPTLGFVDIPLIQIWTIGAVALFIIWLFYSRLFHYVFAIVLWIGKPVVDFGFYPVFFAAVLLNILLLPIALPVERRLVRRWLRKHKSERTARWKEAGEKDPEAAYEKWLDQFKKSHGDDALEKIAGEKIPFHASFVVDCTLVAGEKLLTPLHSSIRIGIAPLVHYSESEGIRTTREPLQDFATGIACLRTRLDDVNALRDVHFYGLPPHLPITTQGRAASARWLFRLDVLVWGRYFPSGDRVVWVFFQQNRAGADSKQDEDKYGQSYQNNLFPGMYKSFQVNIPAMRFSPDDPMDVYLTVLLAVLQAFERRGEHRWRWFKRWDRLSASASAVVNDLLRHLVLEIFLTLPSLAEPESLVPSVRGQLAEVAGHWLGQQLLSKLSRFGNDEWDGRPNSRFMTQLDEIAQKCIAWMPSNPEHYYRQGAICCLLGDKERAAGVFRRAGELDRHSRKVGAVGAQVAAEMALEDAAREVGLEQTLALARFATHAACALNNGDDFTVKQIREILAKSSVAQLAAAGNEKLPALEAIEELLEQRT